MLVTLTMLAMFACFFSGLYVLVMDGDTPVLFVTISTFALFLLGLFACYLWA